MEFEKIALNIDLHSPPKNCKAREGLFRGCGISKTWFHRNLADDLELFGTASYQGGGRGGGQGTVCESCSFFLGF